MPPRLVVASVALCIRWCEPQVRLVRREMDAADCSSLMIRAAGEGKKEIETKMIAGLVVLLVVTCQITRLPEFRVPAFLAHCS